MRSQHRPMPEFSFFFCLAVDLYLPWFSIVDQKFGAVFLFSSIKQCGPKKLVQSFFLALWTKDLVQFFFLLLFSIVNQKSGAVFLSSIVDQKSGADFLSSIVDQNLVQTFFLALWTKHLVQSFFLLLFSIVDQKSDAVTTQT